LGLNKKGDTNGKYGDYGQSPDPEPTRPSPTYLTYADAIQAATPRGGTFTDLWESPPTGTTQGMDELGAMVVARYDFADGSKQFRPVHRIVTGWKIGDPPGALPLYRGNDLPADKTIPILIGEGEKVCDIYRDLGFFAVTSAHGSNSPDKSDWSPLAGRTVYILPDNDDPGRKYADVVARILIAMGCRVKIVTLPGLPPGGDIEQFREAVGDRDEIVRAEIERITSDVPFLGAGPRVKPATKRAALRRVQDYRPFPLDVLPKVLRRFVEDGAKAMGCDPAYIALPLLAALSSAVGNSRTVRIKSGWTEPAVLWAALVAASGTLKSPAYKLALRSIQRRQSELWTAYKNAVDEYRESLKKWKSLPKNERGEEPEEPPALEHLYCGDVTVEALALRLGTRGLLVTVDELAGWFKSWNAYKQKGGDCESYLSFYDAAAAKIDRKTSLPPTIFIPRAFVAVAGGIQPGILQRLLTEDHFDSGLLARFLIAHPPESVVTWRDDNVGADVLASVDDVFAKLWSLPMQTTDDGSLEPVSLSLTESGVQKFAEYVNRNGAEYSALLDDRLKAAWAKLRGAAARLALVLHCSSVAAGEQVYPDAVDETSVINGIKLADWFGNEATRLYSVIDESSEDRHSRELVDLIRGMGGRVTVRELRQKWRRYRDDPEQAQTDLDRLAEVGSGAWEYPPPGERGGRPSTVFVLTLNTVNANDTPDGEAENRGIGFVDAAYRSNGAGRDRGES
jgi:hypothetical protein